MRGREFLDLARELVTESAERHWRGAVIHAYYALMLECREALVRWGRPAPARQRVHQDVRLTFTFASQQDLKDIGDDLEALGKARNRASYELTPLPEFASNVEAGKYAQRAGNALALLDAIEADPARQAAAVASLPPP